MNFKFKTTTIQEQEITIPCFPYFAINEQKDQAFCIHSEDSCTHLFIGGASMKHFYITGGTSSSFHSAFAKGWSPCSVQEYRYLLDKIMDHAINLNLAFFRISKEDQDSAEHDSLKFNLENPEGDA
jgi:hypothetical protein